MSGPDPEQPPEGDADRTVFQPLPAPGQQSAAPAPPMPPPAPSPAPRTEAPMNTDMPFAPAPAAGSRLRPIEIGDVLNHIFEVKRFIARGGMGEVFEGANVNSDERVAIKVMLPHLAADPNVQAMFRKEARTLTRISHPALVQYRVLAQEPNLGVFYIVTEYIDGRNLSDVLKTIDYSPADLTALLKKLAQGLEAAHALGAVHRDISPDNVMLEGGTLSGAKIIDFGIAKDLDPGSATIIGDGFAGKLNYVAPEQLGDFDRAVGPWTDIYSLALVILAVAQRSDVNMGGSLVDAVDKRRAGPDIASVPAELQPILAKMLRPNPAERARSMGEVLDLIALPPSQWSALGLGEGAVREAPYASAGAKPAKAPKPPKPHKPPNENGDNWLKAHRPIVSGGAAVFVLLIAAGIFFSRSGSEKPADRATGATSAAVTASTESPVDVTRAALRAGLPAIACTWLDIVNVSAADGGVSLTLRGVAGKPADAQSEISRLLAAKGVKVNGIDFGDVSPIQPSECGPLEAFRQIRAPSADRLSVAQRQWEMGILSNVGADNGKLGSTAIVEVNLGGVTSQATLYGLEESGQITEILPDRASFDQEGINKVADGRYRIPLATTHEGWSGVLLLTGNGPFDAKLIAGPPGSRGPDWPQRFLAKARAQGWQSEMVWYKTVDQQPN